MTHLTHLDLFAGIGGFSRAFASVGAATIAFCEIDKTCHRVLRRHHPDVEIIEDVKTITKETFAERTIDLITGGFPCQDLSVAGRRKGLDGERSGLWFEMLRIIECYKPRWVVVENVPGLLSSNGGRDFALILSGLVKCGYGVAWRILDAQYFGLAQRRKRVFIVASLGSGRCAEVLFEREGGAWDSAPSRETRQRVAGTIAAGAHASGFNGQDAYQDKLIAHPITASYGKQVDSSDRADGPPNLILAFGGGNRNEIEVSTSISSSNTRYDFESETLIAHSLRGESFDASEDGTGRSTPLVSAPELSQPILSSGRGFERIGDSRGQDTLIVSTLTSNGDAHGGFREGDGQTIAFTERTRAEGRNLETQDDLAYAITNPGSGGRTHSRQIAGGFGVRRLTPRECERLQGYPDDFTRWDDLGKEISDSARYRMLGNSIAVPCVEWIARRIAALEAK